MLAVQHVVKRYGRRLALDRMSLEVEAGSIVGLLGPNGAGKTTLLRALMGLLPIDGGNIVFFGQHAPGETTVRRALGYMPQRIAIYPGLSIRENVLFFGRMYGVPADALDTRCDEVLELVHLRDRQGDMAGELSGGQARRVMLATALVHRPKVLILDEPTAGVDPVLRVRFWDWFEQLTQSGLAILITTHHISEAARSKRVVFIRDGRNLAEGSPQDLMGLYQAKDLEAAFVRATAELEPGAAQGDST